MNNPNADFHMVSLADGVVIDPETVEKAKVVLESLHADEKLPPLDGWEGSPLEGYMDVLGLNGRPIRVNHGPGLRH